MDFTPAAYRVTSQLPFRRSELVAHDLIGINSFGMSRLAAILRTRLEPGQGRRSGRPSDPVWILQRKVPMSQATLERLTQLAKSISMAERKVSPMQVAAQLLEDSLNRVSS
jgi:hypothetical protein